MKSAWLLLIIGAAAGCSREGAEPPSPFGPEPGPGRYPHSTVQQTAGPADGPAIELILSETPIQVGELGGPHIRIGLNGLPANWSNRSAQIDPADWRTGWAAYYSNRKSERLKEVEVQFGPITEGQPVEGRYAVTLPNGTTVRGSFRATWLPPQPGG